MSRSRRRAASPAGQAGRDGLNGEVPIGLRRWLAPRLLRWFGEHRRDLPWRRDRDPYRIWVSEVMLQQTQVSTVVGYFERFLARFPTLAELARAEEQEVLRLWEGLGYYRRARDLHRAAGLMVARHQGQFPADPEALVGLPGLGEYTRNAVLSQAFDLRLPILEANSQRVLSRVLGYEEDPRQGPARRRLWQAAAALLPRLNVGEFNQALMELGALVCSATSPTCASCPLAPRCVAREQGRAEQIPVRKPPPATTAVRETAVVVRREGRVLLVQRPDSGRWASLWEFPHGPVAEGESPDQAASRLVGELTGMQVELGAELRTIRHGVTRYQITLVCFEAEHRAGEFRPGFYVRAAWLEPEELASYPVSSPQRRLARTLAEPGRQRRLF
jgi:A/G-specific adenine glycosylase